MRLSRPWQHVFTLQGAEHAYRVLIGIDDEGALTLTPGKNDSLCQPVFRQDVKCPRSRCWAVPFAVSSPSKTGRHSIVPATA